MKCPVCKEHNLVISERKGIEIDYCTECRGVWLDRGELDKILERTKGDESPVRQETVPYQPSPVPGYHQKPYKRKKSFFEELFD